MPRRAGCFAESEETIIKKISSLCLLPFVICFLFCSCASPLPHIDDGAVFSCGELRFEICLSSDPVRVEILKPDTLDGMLLSFGETTLCTYKGLETVMPYSACMIPYDAVKASETINGNTPVSRTESENGTTIFTYALDETRCLVYYDTKQQSVVGFFVGDRYYQLIDGDD